MIRYVGSASRGYTVTSDNTTRIAHVRRSNGGWEGSYAGDPSARNLRIEQEDGSVSHSCQCPMVSVGTYPRRQDAADAALSAADAEDRLDVARCAACGDTGQRADLDPRGSCGCDDNHDGSTDHDDYSANHAHCGWGDPRT